MNLRIRSWNVNGLGGPEVWGDIAAGDVDVALLQECRRPPADFDGRVVHDRGLKSGTDEDTFAELVKNTYRVLLSRGLKGCYVHFLDEPTRDFVESRIDLATTLDEVRTQLAAEDEG